MDVRRHGLPNPSDKLKRMEANARGIADVIGAQMPKGWGFALLFFEFNGRESSWISNAKRSDMVKMLREMADKLEVDAAGGPVAPFSQ
jgi:hypothetical protein